MRMVQVPPVRADVAGRIVSRRWRFTSLALVVVAMMTTRSLGTRAVLPLISPNQEATPQCIDLQALAVQCQPAVTAILWCSPNCDPNDPRPRGQSCTVEVYAEGSSMWPREEVEGWWIVWSYVDRQFYYVYDGHLDVGASGKIRRFTLCDRRCGYQLQGYTWVWLYPDYPDISHPAARVVASSCEDCLLPTPVVGEDSQPSRCRNRVFLPAVHRP
jgi:hypothetical protein